MEGFWPTDSGGCFFGDGDPGVLFWGSDEAGCFKASGIFYGMNREVPRIWRWRSIIALYGVASKSDGFWAKWEIHSHRPQKITLKVSKWQQLTSTNYVPKKNVSENLKKISFDFSLPLKSLHKCLFFVSNKNLPKKKSAIFVVASHPTPAGHVLWISMLWGFNAWRRCGWLEFAHQVYRPSKCLGNFGASLHGHSLIIFGSIMIWFFVHGFLMMFFVCLQNVRCLRFCCFFSPCHADGNFDVFFHQLGPRVHTGGLAIATRIPRWNSSIVQVTWSYIRGQWDQRSWKIMLEKNI